MTQQEIEARALELYPERKRQNKKGTGEYDANLPRRKAYIKGWTDAQSTMSGDSPLADKNRLTDDEINELRKEIMSGDSPLADMVQV